VTPEGGVLARTPARPSRENRQIRTGRIAISPSGGAEASINTVWTGDQADYPREVLRNSSPEEIRKWILNNLQVSNVRLQKYELPDVMSRSARLTMSIGLDLPQLAGMSGTRLFLHPNAFEQRSSTPRDFAHRRSPVRLPYAYVDSDSLVFLLPPGFVLEAFPAPSDLKRSFGTFHEGVLQGADGTLLFERRLEFASSTIPPGEYAEYRSFMAEVVKADRMQVVLRRERK
jgi:hypothetical protein